MATASQLVLRARTSGDLSLLDAAMPLARDAVDWHAIADSDPDRAITALAQALAMAGTDVGVYRSVSRIQRTRLSDPAAAARTLAAGAAALLAADPPTTDWCLLADGWERLGDHDAALDYLRHASASARTSADCCAVGELDRAEALATTVHDRIAIAKACDDAQDFDRLTANLAAAIDAIASVDDAVATMRALELFDAGDDERTRCYAGSARYAKTASELIALSRIAPTREESQRCLDAADPIAGPLERQRIAMLSRRPSGEWDDSRIPQLTPAELMPWSARSLGWPHEPARLFDLLRARVDADTISEIAGSDYGMDIVEHTAALEQIVAGRVPHPLAWHPLEVLQLTRWTEGDEIDHVARAFCTCVLSLDEAGPTSMHDGNESTIPVLLHSCLVLGTEMIDAAIGFYAAFAGSCRDPVVRAFAELAMVVAAAWRDADDPRIAEVVRRLIHEEPTLRKQAVLVESGWLLGCTNFDQRHALFRALVQSVLAPVVGHHPQLTQLASLVAGG